MHTNSIAAHLGVAFGLLLSALVQTAQAQETARHDVTMNKTGMYEETMKFYLHPAHGFPAPAQSQAPSEQAGPQTLAQQQAKPSRWVGAAAIKR